MPRGPRRPLCLCFFLLLLLHPGAADRPGAARPGEGAEEPGWASPWPGLQHLQQQLRTAGALSRRYWALFSCRVWPGECEEDEVAATPLGWSLPVLGQRYVDMLAAWYCRLQDCCDSDDCRISNNFTGLDSDLSVRLHGQHLARELVLQTVRGYLETPLPDKALALSFHGWSGTGKNFVARILAENLYRDGQKSPCVRVFIATIHFPHSKYVDLYQDWLLGQMQEAQQRCRQTLFIFDEAEKLHPELLELLGLQLEHRAPEKPGARPQRSIFVFLSNLGGSAINQAVLDLLKAGRSREEITMDHLGPKLQAEMAASPGSSFGHSHLVKENLIDTFVPFLPLEFHHVRLCARDAFLSQDLAYTEETLDRVARTMTYIPKEEQRFSSQGCKSISQRIHYFQP